MFGCYMFGAGVNGYGVLKFFGSSIIGVVDNDPKKLGEDFCGYTIISFDDLRDRWDGEWIIVSTYSRSDDVVNQLKSVGITRVYVAPLMQNGFWRDADNIINQYGIIKRDKVTFDEYNPISNAMISRLKERKYCGHIHECESAQELASIEELFVTNCVNAKELRDREKKIIDLTSFTRERKKNLEKYHNIHQGERCFIIGNGPSLQIEDLDRLNENKDICFGSNSIWNLYSETKWRPYYYVIADFKAWIKANTETDISFVDVSSRFFCADFFNSLYSYPQNTSLYNLLPFRDDRGFSDDITENVYSGGTVTYVAIQIAAYMGFREIYLLGVDCTSNGHFYSEQKTNHNAGTWDERTWHKEYWEAAYGLANEYCKKEGIRIINATRGGELECFRRENFDDLFDV